jgi:hypothetical protein
MMYGYSAMPLGWIVQLLLGQSSFLLEALLRLEPIRPPFTTLPIIE